MRFVLALIVLTSCSYEAVNHVYIRRGFESQKLAVSVAVNKTESIWRTAAFWDLVESYVWIPGPTEDPVNGKAVRDALETHRPIEQRYRLVAFNGWNILTLIRSSENARTSACQPIALYRRHVPSDTLVDTIAHENAHAAKVNGRCDTHFFDKGYTDYDLPWLVSYGIGDLAQCFQWKNGDPAQTATCFSGIVNGERSCRAFQQCCFSNDDPVPAHIARAREQAPQCRASCDAIKADCDRLRYEPVR